MVFVSSMKNYGLLVVMRVEQLLEHVFVSSMRNYVLSVVMRVEQLSVVGNHALPVVMRVEQQWSMIFSLYRQACFACHHES